MKNALLYGLFCKAQKGDELAKVEIYNKFLPCIKGFGRKLNYEEAETDLIIFLLEFISKIDLKKFKNRNEGEIINYVHAAFKNKYINLLRIIINKNLELSILDVELVHLDYYEKLEKDSFLILLKNLNTIQKKIIIGKYVYDYSDTELAAILKLSRQSIYKNKKKAFDILKDSMMEDGEFKNGRKII